MRSYKVSLPKTDVIFLFASILLTIIAQHPELIESGSGRYLLLVWALPITRLVLLKKIRLNRSIRPPIILYFFLFVFLLLAEVFSGAQYLAMPIFYNISMMLSMMLIGYYLGSQITEGDLRKVLFWVSIVGGLILCLGIYNYSFSSDFDISARTYYYKSKNSASQIIFSCFIFSLLLPQKGTFSAIKYPILIFMGYLILIMRSRATILGFIILIAVLLWITKNRKFKLGLILFLITGIYLIVNSQYLSTTFIEGIMLAGRDPNNLNEISSNRISMLFSFPTLFQERLLIGRGDYYVESFPLATLIQVGIIGSLIIFSFLLWVIKVIKSKFITSNKLDLSLIILFGSYLVNSLFEEQAPFGPGTKSFLFWLPFGFVLYYRISLERPLNDEMPNRDYLKD